MKVTKTMPFRMIPPLSPHPLGLLRPPFKRQCRINSNKMTTMLLLLHQQQLMPQ